MPLDADKYSTCPITQWHINVEEYESDFKKYFTGNLISLWFYSCKILRRELKMDPTAPNIIFYFFWNEFLLAYNGKNIRKECFCQYLLHCSKGLHNLLQNNLQCTELSSQEDHLHSNFIHSDAAEGLPQPTKLHLMCSENIIKEVLDIFSS